MIIDPSTEKDDLEAPIITLKPNAYNRLSWEVLCDLLSPDNQKYLLVPGEDDNLNERDIVQNSEIFSGNSLTPAGFSLTRQQRVIMELAIEGLLTKQIAERLCLSYHTIKNHLSKIYEKMGVNSMAEAIDVYLDYRKRMN
jgi:DNA-binding CsgD family transcriptional regulator